MNDTAAHRIRPARECRSFAPGHTVHAIQWNKAYKDPSTRRPAQLVGIDDNALLVRCDGEDHRFRNHDLDRARDLYREHGPHVHLQQRWGVLWFDTYIISIHEDATELLGPCMTEGSSHGWLVRPEFDELPGGR